MVRSHSRLPIPLQADPLQIAIVSVKSSPEIRMLKFLGSTIGIIFIIGLIVTIILLKAIF